MDEQTLNTLEIPEQLKLKLPEPTDAEQGELPLTFIQTDEDVASNAEPLIA